LNYRFPIVRNEKNQIPFLSNFLQLLKFDFQIFNSTHLPAVVILNLGVIALKLNLKVEASK
jgi:hypothetical protein